MAKKKKKKEREEMGRVATTPLITKPTFIRNELKKGFYELDTGRCYDTAFNEWIKEIPGTRWNWDVKRREVPIELAAAVDARAKLYFGKGIIYPPPLPYAKPPHWTKLSPFQQLFVDRVIEQHGGFAMFDPGLGKSAAALAAREGCTLVICPLSVATTWEKEHIPKWAREGATIYRHRSAKGWRYEGQEFIIISMDSLHTLEGKLPSKVWGVVVDEVHHFKNYKALRVQQLGKLLEEHPEARRIGLTGTMVAKHPLDIYQPVHLFWPWRFGKPSTFKERYFHLERGYGNSVIPRGLNERHQAELRTRLAGIGVIALEEDYPHLLPPLHMERVLIDLDTVELPDTVELFDGVDRATLTSIGETQCQRQLELIAPYKIYPAMDRAAEKMREGHSHIVVICYHRAVAAMVFNSVVNTKEYKEGGYQGVLATGEQTPEERLTRLEKAANADKAVAVVTMSAVGEGINIMGKFRQGILAELTWRPSLLKQMIARLRRRGQGLIPVNLEVLICPGTIDDAIMACLRDEVEMVAALTGETVGSLTTLKTEVLEMEDQESWRDGLMRAIQNLTSTDDYQ
ncbi:chromatin remodeling complex ATPase-like protein [Bacteriophage sp.]|nr:chromatin remodeling complex ATPase-like protein [Bacteriophage sp.]